MSNINGLSRLSAVLGFAALSSGALFMMAAQPADKPAVAPASREGQPAGQPGGQPGEPGTGRGPRRAGGGDFANIEQAMKAMNGGLRELTKSVSDTTKKSANLGFVAQMQRGALYSKNNAPKNIKGGESSAEDFRRAQITLMRMLLDLETNILDGKTAEAAKAIEALEAFEKSQHDRFIDEGKGDKPANAEPKREEKK